MALRIDEKTIVSAEICNRQKHHVSVEILFVDGLVLKGALRGNPHRDLAGRTLRLRQPKPDRKLRSPQTLSPEQTGVCGDITASHKAMVPVSSGGSSAKEEAMTWKNCVYLEWYSRANGRVVLEASCFQLEVSEAAWVMSATEEEEAKASAAGALGDFLDQLCVIDRSKENKEDQPMDEYAWEKFLRHSDDLTNRYSELIDKFGIDNKEQIANFMQWDHEVEETAPGWLEYDVSFEDDEEEIELDREDEEALLRQHPLESEARKLLDSLDFSDGEPGSELASLWGIVAVVSAKLAGALSNYERGRFTDAGFTIAQLKRCLRHIDRAVGEARAVSPDHVQPLLRMRQSILDLQNELRGTM